MNGDNDPRHHFEIWTGPSASFVEKAPIYYVENHNGQCGYADLATDFEMTLALVFDAHRHDGLGNWTSQIAHLVRQVLELRLKALFEQITLEDSRVQPKPLKAHDLSALWGGSRSWLIGAAYPVETDARLATTDLLIQAFHAVDPRGDLFRFGMSRQGAFGRPKSYDRVGINVDRLENDFAAANQFLGHWETTLWRGRLAKEEGWKEDHFFDADDFPRRSAE